MSRMSNLATEIEDKIADTRTVRVDSFPNGRAYRWLVLLETEEGTLSVGIIEKKPNTNTERHPFKSWVYFESIKGDMSAPNWVDMRPESMMLTGCTRQSDLSIVNNACLGELTPNDFESFDYLTASPAAIHVLEEMYYKIAVAI